MAYCDYCELENSSDDGVDGGKIDLVWLKNVQKHREAFFIKYFILWRNLFG